MGARTRLTTRIARRLAPKRIRERVERMRFHDAGHGYDVFGMQPDGMLEALTAVWPLYAHYFRVDSHGAENIPTDGAAVLAANHSGMLPLDSFMIAVDVFMQVEPPRVARAVADHFVPRMPWFGAFVARAGAVGGSRGNVHEVLARGELLLVHPEGTRGVGKPFRERYQLQEWTVGHVELAITHRAPVIPVALIGAEEQWPQLTRIESVKLFGAPWVPIPASPVPLPVHYHVYYGEPIHLEREHEPADAEDPQVLENAAARVKTAVAELIERGLAERKGVFR